MMAAMADSEETLDHRAQEAGGYLERRRQAQALSWMRELISSGLQEIFQNASAVQGASCSAGALGPGVRDKPIEGSARTARSLPRFDPTTINGLRLAAGARPAAC